MSAESTAPLTRGPRRLALTLACLTGALLVIGGLVTTYRVGMAVVDWPTTFGYSMFSYPLDHMLEDFGVTVEHTHRMVASTVGLVSLILVVVTAAGVGGRVATLTWLAGLAECLLVLEVVRTGAVGGSVQALLLGTVFVLLLVGLALPGRRPQRAIANSIHLAVIGQGVLGGTRVLENSQHLAFLHGSAAQLVFLLMLMGVVLTSPRFVQAHAAPGAGGQGLASLAWGTAGLVYLQSVLGAWLRHTGMSKPLTLHLAFAFVVVGMVLLLARRLKAVADEGPGRSPLAQLRTYLLILLGVQVGLGMASLAAILILGGGFEGRVTVIEAITTSAHVLVGGLLLGTCASSGLWSTRTLCLPGSGGGAPGASLGGGLA